MACSSNQLVTTVFPEQSDEAPLTSANTLEEFVSSAPVESARLRSGCRTWAAVVAIGAVVLIAGVASFLSAERASRGSKVSASPEHGLALWDANQIRCGRYVCDCGWAAGNPQGTCSQVDYPRTKCWSCCCSHIAPELYRQAILLRYSGGGRLRSMTSNYGSNDFRDAGYGGGRLRSMTSNSGSNVFRDDGYSGDHGDDYYGHTDDHYRGEDYIYDRHDRPERRWN